jgi:hypothetical protein
MYFLMNILYIIYYIDSIFINVIKRKMVQLISPILEKNEKLYPQYK